MALPPILGSSDKDPSEFGMTRASPPSFQNGVTQVRSTGKLFNPETNLSYFGARYYSPFLGRFLTPDWSATPAAVLYADRSDPQTLSLYAYTSNNPVTKVDKDGHLSDLTYDGATDVLTFRDRSGKVVGQWPAGNHVAVHADAGNGRHPCVQRGCDPARQRNCPFPAS